MNFPAAQCLEFFIAPQELPVFNFAATGENTYSVEPNNSLLSRIWKMSDFSDNIKIYSICLYFWKEIV